MNEQAIAQAAVTSLQAEVQLAPKPGLVDPESNGAHRDMDVTTFAASIEALTPYFQQYFHAGALLKRYLIFIANYAPLGLQQKMPCSPLLLVLIRIEGLTSPLVFYWVHWAGSCSNNPCSK